MTIRNPKWRTSLHGGYIEADFHGTAKSYFCTASGGVNSAAICGLSTAAGGTCDPNHSWWVVGTRTQWNPHPDLDIGLELMWTHLNTAFKGATITASSGAQPPGAIVDDQDVLSVYFRIQRNFLP